MIPGACGGFYLNSVYPWLLSLSVGRMVLLPYDCLVLFPSGCLSWNKTQSLVVGLAVGLDDFRDFFFFPA